MKLISPMTHKHSVDIVSNENDIQRIHSQCEMILWSNVILTALASTFISLSPCYSPHIFTTLPTTIKLRAGPEETHIACRIALWTAYDYHTAIAISRACSYRHALRGRVLRPCGNEAESHTGYFQYSQVPVDSEVYFLAQSYIFIIYSYF